MISKDEVKKLSELARINLSAKEKEKLAKDLEAILRYVEKLKEVDISQAPEMTHAVWTKNVFREDKEEKRDDILLAEQFPDEERGHLKVKEVFKRE